MVLIGILLMCFSVGVAASPENDSRAAPNPFGGFETIILPNGLRVWFKSVPQYPNFAITISIPYGADNDTPGLEELAHFTEHMPFSGHMGRTEQEIKAEINDLGGSHNGLTYPDHTSYYAVVDSRHALFAIDWLYRIVSPHNMAPEIVEQQRTPIVLELGAKPRGLIDWIQAVYINPPFLRLPNFWKRGFGLSTRADRDYYPYRSLRSITSEDLQQFYNTFYVPSRMILTVVGNIDRTAVLAKINETFATLPSRPIPPSLPPLHDPKRNRRIYQWEERSDVLYSRWFKLYAPTAREQLLLHVIEGILHRRLKKKLRYGDKKAIYNIRVGTRQRQVATALYIYGAIEEKELAFARSVIDDEIRSLRGGLFSDEEFSIGKTALISRWRKNYSAVQYLIAWVRSNVYNPERFRDFPDIVSFTENLSREDVVSFAREHLVAEHEEFCLIRPLPLRLETIIIIGVLMLWLIIKVSRWLLISPVDMSSICYVAHFRIPLVIRIVGGTFLVIILAFIERLLVYGAFYMYNSYLLSVDSFWIQGVYVSLVAASGIFIFIMILAWVPHKLLVFENHIRIKYIFYRSRIIRAEDIVELAPYHFAQIFFNRRIWQCTTLTFGFLKPGLYLRVRGGRNLFFQVRKQSEALLVITEQKLISSKENNDPD